MEYYRTWALCWYFFLAIRIKNLGNLKHDNVAHYTTLLLKFLRTFRIRIPSRDEWTDVSKKDTGNYHEDFSDDQDISVSK